MIKNTNTNHLTFQGLTWGRAFLLGSSASSSLSYLESRETKLGGYCTTVVTFHPRDEHTDPFPALLYVALPSNRLYVGPAPLPTVASDIAEAAGHCGHNAEYLIRLVDFMKEQVPGVWDEHLYHLDHLVRARLKEKNVKVEEVMGDETPLAVAGLSSESSDDEVCPTSSSPSDYVSRVPKRKVRCLDI